MPKKDNYVVPRQDDRTAMKTYFGAPKHAFLTLSLGEAYGCPWPAFMRIWGGFAVPPDDEQIARHALLLWRQRNPVAAPEDFALTKYDIRDLFHKPPVDTRPPADATGRTVTADVLDQREEARDPYLRYANAKARAERRYKLAQDAFDEAAREIEHAENERNAAVYEYNNFISEETARRNVAKESQDG